MNHKKNHFLVKILAAALLFCAVSPGVISQEKRALTVLPESIKPGEPLAIAVTTPGYENLTADITDLNGKRIGRSKFFPLTSGESIQVSLWAVPSTAVPGKAVITVKDGQITIGTIPLTIEQRDFPSEELALSAGNTALRTEPDPQKTRESEILWQILSTTGKDVYCTDPVFMPPVESKRRTSFYGTRRVYVYSNGTRDTSIHAGVDYGVPLGTPVKACSSGLVVLANPRIISGNSIIIEHYPGVYSIYYHLDKIHVKEGDLVEIGKVIGLSGTTGFSTGPHLHWEMRVATENADPDAFLARKLLDKEAIISKINSLIKN